MAYNYFLVTGVYVRRIFVEELGASPDNNVFRIVPLDNFGEVHPDPNLVYAKDLVDKVKGNSYDMGVAFDGDGVSTYLHFNQLIEIIEKLFLGS